MDFRKGQAAMEYLMTYGWAILVIVIVVAVLFYIGVFNPQAPIACTFKTPGISCSAYKLATDGTLTLKIGQATGKTITVRAVACTDQTLSTVNDNMNNEVDDADCVFTWTELSPGIDIQNGQDAEIIDGTTKLKCCRGATETEISGSIGDRYRGKIYVYYAEKDTGYTHAAIGDLSAQLEPA
ncbi:MAG: hypothetical protein QXP42_00125 [Candidatus Micrarchaeia archaeon]